MINTVSQNYARELQETDGDYLTGWLGHRLKDNGVEIVGITNGIDPGDFDTTDPESLGISSAFDVRDENDDLQGKQLCKNELINGFADEPQETDESRVGHLSKATSWPLYTFIGRLSDQKGVDILCDAISLFLAEESEAQILCLGNGGEEEEAALSAVALDEQFIGRVCFLRGFNVALANKVYAAGDFFIIPSRYEPCGLTDFIAQLFGNVPIVHRVGGLVKVIDGETGFGYQENSAENLVMTMQRASTVFKDKQLIRRMQRRAVAEIDRNYVWDKVMKNYVDLYKSAVADVTTRKIA